MMLSRNMTCLLFVKVETGGRGGSGEMRPEIGGLSAHRVPPTSAPSQTRHPPVMSVSQPPGAPAVCLELHPTHENTMVCGLLEPIP